MREDLIILEQEDCKMLYDALKVYVFHLDAIKASCRKPVMMDGVPIEVKTAMARNLMYSVGARAGKERKK